MKPSPHWKTLRERMIRATEMMVDETAFIPLFWRA
jgi:hypothetical protein